VTGAECKNCNEQLSVIQNFCPQCGAKVIRNRLSFRILWEDFQDRFMNYDNTFFITFIHLFVKPQNVIAGYISGVRKRYIDPLSYLGIALTLSGIQLFITRKVADKINWDVYDQGVNPELMAKIAENVFDYSSFMFLVFIPVFGFAGWLTFNRKGYLISEFCVLFVYVLSHWSIVLFLPVGVLLVLAPEQYLQLSLPMFLTMMGYSVYCLQRIHKYAWPQFVIRGGLYFVLITIGYLGLILVFYTILFATGTISMEDFVPPK
jgi:hypothetical protein